MRKLKTPDVTKVQAGSFATALIGILTAAGVPVSEANANRIFVASLTMAVVSTIADAAIRVGRALMMGKLIDPQDELESELD